MTCTDCKHEWDGEKPRCCPRCNSPYWQGRREVDNYPAQDGFQGAVAGAPHDFRDKFQQVL